MRRVASIVLLVTFLFSSIPLTGYAEENSSPIIFFDDGSYLLMSIQSIDIRATGTKTGTKKADYYSSSDELLWNVTLRGTFSYTGTSADCTSTTCNVTVYNSSWYEVSKSATKSGATAYCEATLGQKFLGITIDKKTVSMSLSCDANGNLS